MNSKPHVLWDLPIRIFHWSIVACVLLAWLSAEFDYYDVHEWVGYTVIVLVVWRIIWGIVGSRHARFSDFVTGPAGIIAYLKGKGAASAGHNPLGALSVIALLGLLLLQAVSGLFNSDDVLFSGPLYYAAETEFRDTMGVIHEIAFDLLVVLIVLHVLVIAWHQLRLHEKLLQAMIKGRAAGREGRAAPVPLWRALLILVLVAAALWWGLEQAPAPPPVMW
tara:strand:+ start:36859 stop:37521 length:663 start_codon:yes stop_codon:yes gene_type:complete